VCIFSRNFSLSTRTNKSATPARTKRLASIDSMGALNEHGT
jgi:hypothetical protein